MHARAHTNQTDILANACTQTHTHTHTVAYALRVLALPVRHPVHRDVESTGGNQPEHSPPKNTHTHTHRERETHTQTHTVAYALRVLALPVRHPVHRDVESTGGDQPEHIASSLRV